MRSYIYTGQHENPVTRRQCDGRAILVGPDDATPPATIDRLPGMCLDCVAVGIRVDLVREIPCTEVS